MGKVGYTESEVKSIVAKLEEEKTNLDGYTKKLNTELDKINEAWEGYKLGKDVYLKIQPCELQFNTMENPSKCHFGFIGSYYNINEDKVFSLVDTLKLENIDDDTY